METKEQNNPGVETKRISLKDRDRIINCVESLTHVIGLRDWATRIAASLAVRSHLDTADHMNTMDLEVEATDITMILDLLTVISEVAAKNDGVLYFPDQIDLSESDRLELEYKRVRDRAINLMGDRKDLAEHRENLKRVFGKTMDPELLKTWAALDADLEADMKYLEVLTSNN